LPDCLPPILEPKHPNRRSEQHLRLASTLAMAALSRPRSAQGRLAPEKEIRTGGLASATAPTRPTVRVTEMSAANRTSPPNSCTGSR
jgi:hypothetical protein